MPAHVAPVVLGVPVATDANSFHLRDALQGHAAAFRGLAERIAALPDSQVAHALLRQCLGPCNVQHLLRWLPARLTATMATAITVAQKAAFGAIAGRPLTIEAWMQATLPLSMGGCGIQAADTLAPVARLGGVLQYLQYAEAIAGRAPGLIGPLPETDGSLLVALRARLPPDLARLTAWERSGQITLCRGDAAKQHWWSE